ncbi:MAG: antitermination protein NusG [Acidobacteria bacterium]|nr:MAG: antitermination protein NusG [Acidobacteriota bacterium]
MHLVKNSTITFNNQAGSAWYALYTRHQHEKAVAKILSTRGFEVFLPLYFVIHRWKDRFKQLSLPLFPCYVFLYGKLEQRPEILSTPGVYFFVGSASQPAPLPQAEIESLQRLVERRMQLEPHPFLKCGDWVRIKSGPLEGIQGILARKKNSLRLVLSVELLRKSIAVEVDSSVVERCLRPDWTVLSGREAEVAFLT